MIHETKYRKQAYSTWEKEKEEVINEWRQTVRKIAHKIRISQQANDAETLPPEVKQTLQENH